MALPLLLALACAGDEAPPPARAHPLDESWLGLISREPERFAEVVGGDREGWAHLHANRLDEALASPGAPDTRAKLELAALHEDLARLQRLALAMALDAWTERAALPESPGLAWTAALVALDAGDEPGARRWLTRGAAGEDAVVAGAAAALLGSLDGQPLVPGDNPLLLRHALHLAARADGDAMHAAVVEAHLPLLREAGPPPRVHYDPQVHTTLALGWRAPARPYGDPLEAWLFTPCLAPPPAPPDEGPLHAACLDADAAWLGLDPRLSGPDDPEAARALARAIDDVVDPWLATRLAVSSPDGAALLRDLDLGALARSQRLLLLARLALRDDRPRQAEALALMALDARAGRRVGPVNHPGLFAALAEAHLRTGHVREALDELQVLVELWPELTGLDELVGDLAILRGLDRVGESKEQ